MGLRFASFLKREKPWFFHLFCPRCNSASRFCDTLQGCARGIPPPVETMPGMPDTWIVAECPYVVNVAPTCLQTFSEDVLSHLLLLMKPVKSERRLR